MFRRGYGDRTGEYPRERSREINWIQVENEIKRVEEVVMVGAQFPLCDGERMID